MTNLSVEMLTILGKVARATERVQDDVVLCGGMAAFAICAHASSKADVALTEDVDLVIERLSFKQKTQPAVAPLLGEILEKDGFRREINALSIGSSDPSEKWVKEGESFYLEFLTEDHKQKIHRISGISALGLAYFSMSLSNTFLFELPSGIAIRVVSPDAFIMHKLLTHPKRKTPFKKYKDLYYVAFVALNAYKSLKQMTDDMMRLDIVPAWHKTAASNMTTLLSNLASWAEHIIGNDPSGFLTQSRIENVYITISEALASLPQQQLYPNKNAKLCQACGKFFRHGSSESKCIACQ